MSNTTDEYWAEKLRRENCDQFNTLVRMHLSFVLDLNTDDNECITEKTKLKKWSFVPFVKKSKGTNRGVMDGAPLTQEGICQVYQLIEYLSKDANINAEGIFRRTGSLTRQQELRALLNQGQPLNLDDGRYSVHDCASVLKGFLAELPEPLLTDAHHPAHCQISELCSTTGQPQAPGAETRLLHSLQLLLLLLPTENRVLLRDVLQLLNETAKRESSNKMSADSLATLFTPHLLCPRRLSPEALHSDSLNLSGIVAFMIRRGVGMFEIPPKLAVDIRSYFTSAPSERSPAANTVYTFVDRERTARAHASHQTETALAQLYAYIQELPESSKKRKLVKQFNRQNGQGTPLQNGARSKSLGDSIKRHIFFHKTMKRTQETTRLRSSSEEVLSEAERATCQDTCASCSFLSARVQAANVAAPPKRSARLLYKIIKFVQMIARYKYCSSGESDAPETNERLIESANETPPQDLISNWREPNRRLTRCFSEPDLSSENICLTSTPAVLSSVKLARDITFTPIGQNGRESMSPITRSTQKMSRAMQETMMTPRSRKPVLLMSNTNVCGLAKLDLAKRDSSISSLLEDLEEESSSSQSHADLIETPVDESFSSRTDDYGYSCISTDNSPIYTDENSPPNRKRSGSDLCGSSKRLSIDKEPVLKPKQYNSDGEPTVFETSF